MAKIRADELLVEKALVLDIDEAKKLIMAGQVRTGSDSLIRKASEMLKTDSPIFVAQKTPYVSRGAYKLKDALAKHLPECDGLHSIDLGSSTGGFTDLLLQSGVHKAYCVDVGKGQLHYKLRLDERVVCLEGVNARYLTQEQVPDPIDILVSDVSFISVIKVLEPCAPFLKKGAFCFVLVKPQFEVERKDVGDGVIRNEDLQKQSVEKVSKFCVQKLNWNFIESIPSPIKGPKGNQEFICVFQTVADPKPPLAACND